MTELKVGKLPDRTAHRLTIRLDAELKAMLDDYVQLYNQAYDDDVGAADLIPFMLLKFMSADRAFCKARKALPDVSQDQASEEMFDAGEGSGPSADSL